MLYFVQGTRCQWLHDPRYRSPRARGRKAIALSRLASTKGDVPALPRDWAVEGLGTGGVLSARQAERTGAQLNVEGPISGSFRVTWTGRLAYLVYDSDVLDNSSVRAAFAVSPRTTKEKAPGSVCNGSEAGRDKRSRRDWLALRGPEEVLSGFVWLRLRSRRWRRCRVVSRWKSEVCTNLKRQGRKEFPLQSSRSACRARNKRSGKLVKAAVLAGPG